MMHEEVENREEQALDALTASFFHIGAEDKLDPLDDPEILDEATRQALAALGDDLVDRLLEAEQPEGNAAPGGSASWDGAGVFALPPEIAALHRGDEFLTPEALEELERHRRELLEDDDDEWEE